DRRCSSAAPAPRPAAGRQTARPSLPYHGASFATRSATALRLVGKGPPGGVPSGRVRVGETFGISGSTITATDKFAFGSASSGGFVLPFKFIDCSRGGSE